MFITGSKYKKIVKLLKLEKPLVIMDIETTGLTVYKDKIVEFGYIKIWPDGREKKEGFMLNPQMPISSETTAIHGYADKDVADKPTFQQKAQEIWEIINDCYYSGYNIVNFDLPILRREFIRVGMDFEYRQERVIDSRVIFQVMVRRSLSTAYKYYCNKELYRAHNALADAEASAEILIKQLEAYEEARDRDFLNQIHKSFDDEMYLYSSRKFVWRNGEAYFTFSKYKNKPLSYVAKKDPKFLKWILSADFSDKTKTIVRKALEDNF